MSTTKTLQTIIEAKKEQEAHKHSFNQSKCPNIPKKSHAKAGYHNRGNR